MLIVTLNLSLVNGETIIIGGDATPPDSLIKNDTVIEDTITGEGLFLGNATSEDIEKLILAINERTDLNERYLIYREVQENRSLNTLENLATALDQNNKLYGEFSSLLDKKDKQIETANSNLLNLQNKVDRLPLLIGIFAVVTFILGVFLTRLYITLRQSKKAFTIVRWIRSVFPFVIGQPEVEVGTSREIESKPNYVILGLMGIIIIVIVVVVFL